MSAAYARLDPTLPAPTTHSFEFSTTPEGHLALAYSSPRRLCAFAEGLIEGSAAHFGETVRVTQPRCARRGDPTCVLVCEQSPGG